MQRWGMIRMALPQQAAITLSSAQVSGVVAQRLAGVPREKPDDSRRRGLAQVAQLFDADADAFAASTQVAATPGCSTPICIASFDGVSVSAAVVLGAADHAVVYAVDAPHGASHGRGAAAQVEDVLLSSKAGAVWHMGPCALALRGADASARSDLELILAGVTAPLFLQQCLLKGGASAAHAAHPLAAAAVPHGTVDTPLGQAALHVLRLGDDTGARHVGLRATVCVPCAPGNAVQVQCVARGPEDALGRIEQAVRKLLAALAPGV